MRAGTALAAKLASLLPQLDERARRLVAAGGGLAGGGGVAGRPDPASRCRAQTPRAEIPAVSGRAGALGGPVHAGRSRVPLTLDLQEYPRLGGGLGAATAAGKPREGGASAAPGRLQAPEQPQERGGGDAATRGGGAGGARGAPPPARPPTPPPPPGPRGPIPLASTTWATTRGS